MFLYYKCYISIDLTFLKELMLIKQANQKNPIFVTICIFLNKDFKLQPSVCNRCQDLLIMSMNLRDIAILNIISADYCCIIRRISKGEVINLMQNADFSKKVEHYKEYKFIITYKNG